MNYEMVSRFLEQIVKLDTFAARVAETVLSKMSPFHYQVAYISNKQAWILVCATVESDTASAIETDDMMRAIEESDPKTLISSRPRGFLGRFLFSQFLHLFLTFAIFDHTQMIL